VAYNVCTAALAEKMSIDPAMYDLHLLTDNKFYDSTVISTVYYHCKVQMNVQD